MLCSSSQVTWYWDQVGRKKKKVWTHLPEGNKFRAKLIFPLAQKKYYLFQFPLNWKSDRLVRRSIRVHPEEISFNLGPSQSRRMKWWRCSLLRVLSHPLFSCYLYADDSQGYVSSLYQFPKAQSATAPGLLQTFAGSFSSFCMDSPVAQILGSDYSLSFFINSIANSVDSMSCIHCFLSILYVSILD